MRKWLVGLMAVWAGMAFAATPKQAVLDVEKMTCPACGIALSRRLAIAYAAHVFAGIARKICRMPHRVCHGIYRLDINCGQAAANLLA